MSCLVLCLCLSLGPLLPCGTAQAQSSFRITQLADKVVRLWFDQQDGIQVKAVLDTLSPADCRELWQAIEVHPFVLEVMDELHGPRQLELYYALQQTILDHLSYR